jgi:hypothetical protein
MAKPIIHPKLHKELPTAVVKQMTALATSGFGLVAALAWNEVIKELVNTYIKPLVGGGSGLITLAIYALLVTILAVFVTLQLSRLEEKIDKINERLQH